MSSPVRGRDRAPSSSPEELNLSAGSIKQLSNIAMKLMPRAQAQKESESVSQHPVSLASNGSGGSRDMVTFPQKQKDPRRELMQRVVPQPCRQRMR